MIWHLMASDFFILHDDMISYPDFIFNISTKEKYLIKSSNDI